VTPPDRGLTRGSLIARNVFLNLGGSALPALAAVVSVPILIRALGDVRFSVLVLAWTTLGYFSLFDLGIGRAVTHAVADRMGSDREHEIGTAIWTALALLLPIGLLSAVLLFTVAPPLATVLGVPAELRSEAIASFRLLALAIPFAALAGALRGALEAKQYFGMVNALRIPHGLITFAGPLLALPFSHSVTAAVAILAVGRALLLVAHVAVTARAIPDFANTASRWSTPIARTLASFGGWTQVTYVVSPLMATLDRFVVGAVLGIAVVTYYAAPQELVTKMWLFTFAVLPVFFSALSVTATRDPERTAALFDKLLRFTLCVMFLPALVIVALAPDILRVWLGPAFETQSAVVMQVMAIAVFVNCVGQGGYTLIQGLGRPDITGKYHLAELPVFALMLWYLLPRYGIMGAALAWSIRTIGDTVLLLGTCPRLLPQARATVVRISAWLGVSSLALLSTMLLEGSAMRLAVTAVGCIAWVALVWRYLLTAQERELPIAKVLTGVLRPEQA
jgi:O-antigen/teichoic acid export membrane protein